MELSHLKYFQLTAELQHITRAAEQLYISQPALSKTISKLEAELGIKLFDREGKNVYLNDYGQAVLVHTERIFSEIDEMCREISDMKNGTAGNLSMAIVWSSSNPNWLTDAITRFIDNFPGVHLRYYKTEDSTLISKLLSREIDIAFSSSPQESPHINWTPLFSEKIGIVVSGNHPLAKRTTLRLEELRNENFVVVDINSDAYQLTMELCEKANFVPNICYAMDNPLLIGHVLEKGQTVSIITENGYRQSSGHDLEFGVVDTKVFIPLQDDFAKRTCYLGTLNNRYQTKAQQDFIAYVKENTAALL